MTIIRIALCFAALYGLVVVAMWWLQPKLLFMPTRDLVQSPRDVGLDFTDVMLQTSDGLAIHGWFVPGDSDAPVVLFFHGNAGNISNRLGTFQFLHRLGASVLMVDYRGYGKSEGTPSEKGSYEDARAAYDWLRNTRNISSNRIVVFGRSLGGGVASWVAAELEVAGLILESSFTSVADRAAELYPWLPVRTLTRYHYNTNRRLADLSTPVLVIHSRQDEVIPFHHGQENFATATSEKYFFELEGSHNDGHAIAGPAYSDAIRTFIFGIAK